MFHVIADILTKEEVARLRLMLKSAKWEDGRATAASYVEDRKDNQQVDRSSSDWPGMERLVFDALQRKRAFVRLARPAKMGGLLFNSYSDGGHYGPHYDDPVLKISGGFRTDVSFTLFLTSPEDYDGGALQIEHANGVREFKESAGALVLYPSHLRHQVTPVTRGARLAAAGWIQSQVRDAQRRDILNDLEISMRHLLDTEPNSDASDRATRAFYALIRLWSDL